MTNGRAFYQWRTQVTRNEPLQRNKWGDEEYRKANTNEKEGSNLEPIEKNEDYKIDKSILSSPEYDKAIKKVVEDKKIAKVVAKEARRILIKMTKTNEEQIVLIKPNGECIFGDKAESGFEAVSSEKQRDETLKPENAGFIIMHNHPKSSLPSAADLNNMKEKWKNAKFGLIACHDGSIIKYTKPFEEVTGNTYNKIVQTSSVYAFY